MSDALPVNSRLPQPSRELTLNKRLQNTLGRDWNVAYVFMLPTVILMGGIIAFPFLRAFYISFTNTITRNWPLGRPDELYQPVDGYLLRVPWL
jgi:ABC-type sugar transport system permease subunit